MEAASRDPNGAGPRNIVLTGFMGTGKSTVGRVLADRLGFEFVDTDRLIEQRHGPIPQIFAERGEHGFRRLEREVAARLAARSGLVIATGGRMMLDAANADLLGGSADVFCLAASVDTIVDRIAADGHPDDRPLLGTEHGDVRSRIETLVADRAVAYGRFRQIDTDARAPEAVADEIMRLRAAD